MSEFLLGLTVGLLICAVPLTWWGMVFFASVRLERQLKRRQKELEEDTFKVPTETENTLQEAEGLIEQNGKCQSKSKSLSAV